MFQNLLSGDLVEKCSKTKCAKYLAEPDFVQALKAIQANPNTLNLYVNKRNFLIIFRKIYIYIPFIIVNYFIII